MQRAQSFFSFRRLLTALTACFGIFVVTQNAEAADEKTAEAQAAKPIQKITSNQFPSGAALRETEPLAPNPYFVQDIDDPRILHRAAGAEKIGIDRGYIEKMARPHLDTKVLDDLDTHIAKNPAMKGQPLQKPKPLAGGLNMATSISGRVIVVEGTTNTVTQNGAQRTFNHNGGGLQTIVQQVWQRLGDQYDFITVFTTFDDNSTAAYYLPLQQSVSGLGDCNFNSGETFGCIFNQLGFDSALQGFVFMNSINSWKSWDANYDGVVHPLDSFDAAVYAVLGQEVAHRWGSGLRFVDPRNGAVSKKLLGRDSSHWAAWVDTDASVMDGWDWEESSTAGTFNLINDMDRFSTLDLYAMGALPVASAKPFFFIDGARFIPNRFLSAQAIPGDAVLQFPSVQFLKDNGVSVQATGTRVDLTIQDIVDAEGNRCPDPDHTQKAFRQAVVLVTAPGQTIAQVQSKIDELETVLTTWESWWRDRTGKALTICTDLEAPCVQGGSTLGGGEIADQDNSIEPGDSGDLNIRVGATGDTLRNARLKIQLTGNGAEKTTIDATEIQVGDVELNGTRDKPLKVSIADDYGCGLSVVARVSLESDNAPTVVEDYRLFPGYEILFQSNFDADDGFSVNKDGKDTTTRGVFARRDIELSCDMTKQTPERDATPEGRGAFVSSGPVSGDTSVWSPEIDITGAVDPEVRFAYWLDGGDSADGAISVAVSGNGGESFKRAEVYGESFHGWVLGRVKLRDLFDDPENADKPGVVGTFGDEQHPELPAKIIVRFIAEGNGTAEVALDDFRVLDFAGTCAPTVLADGCGSCDSVGNGDLTPKSGDLALFGIVGILSGARLLRHQRNQQRSRQRSRQSSQKTN